MEDSEAISRLSLESWKAKVTAHDLLGNTDDAQKACIAYNSVQSEIIAYFYRGSEEGESRAEAFKILTESLQALLQANLMEIFADIAERSKEISIEDVIEAYKTSQIPRERSLDSFSARMIKELTISLIDGGDFEITTAFQLVERNQAEASKILIEFAEDLSRQLPILCPKYNRIISEFACEPFFNFDFQTSKAAGGIYSPPGGPEFHSLLINSPGY